MARLALIALVFVACASGPKSAKEPTSVRVSYASDTSEETTSEGKTSQAKPDKPAPEPDKPAAEPDKPAAEPDKAAPEPPAQDSKPAKPKPTPAKPKPAGPGQVRVVLTGLRNAKGLARIALFTSKSGFPENHKKAFAKANARIKGTSASAVFKKIPPGKFAVVVLHDEDKDGKMKKNFIGVPKEGFGVSRNPKVRMRAPRFGEAALRLAPGQKAKVVIRMKYM